MSALTFTLKTELQQRVDMTQITPDNLTGKSLGEIGAIELFNGKRKLWVDELFAISGDDASDIVINNSSAKLDFIGSFMQSGCITVNGDAGAYLGLQLKRGKITVHGSTETYTASGMSGGLVHVHGNVGDFLGAAIVGDKKGMRGGMVIVSGNAGDRAGDQMRRGMLLIEGNAGSYCGSRMLAGTICVLGDTSSYPGYAMRRGTLLLARQPTLHATIQDCGIHTLPFLSLMFKSFKTLPTRFSHLDNNRVRRYAGDLASDGKGEILVFE